MFCQFTRPLRLRCYLRPFCLSRTLALIQLTLDLRHSSDKSRNGLGRNVACCAEWKSWGIASWWFCSKMWWGAVASYVVACGPQNGCSAWKRYSYEVWRDMQSMKRCYHQLLAHHIDSTKGRHEGHDSAHGLHDQEMLSPKGSCWGLPVKLESLPLNNAETCWNLLKHVRKRRFSSMIFLEDPATSETPEVPHKNSLGVRDRLDQNRKWKW